MKISLEALQILDAIDRRGSFTAAAKVLFKVPSTISYTVSKLEDDLGVQLFERVGPKATPTQAGRELLREGRNLLRAAQELEVRVRRVASGWESDFAIGLDAMLPAALLQAQILDFYAVADSTRLRVLSESLSGSWEALLDRRVDLIVAAGEGPSGGGYVAEQIGTVRFVFAVAATHPLAGAQQLGAAELGDHRAIAVADSARRLLPRTVGLLSGRDVLTVPDMHTKLLLQLAGAGYGFLPEPYARGALLEGRLRQVPVETRKADETFYLAWRPGEEGEALGWWRRALRADGLFERWSQALAETYRFAAAGQSQT
ncbi:LysR family transcriptional regulator [Xanthomonas vesicatoria ATCC 35937]|uniref:Transcriptional regulator n=1 Tax=Xanthomonas vesicatoria ATCC 35937 TaxID=925775 RepID=F0BGD3_9XANT|nr:LysR substrate-binding domain-containing protein [Xanthomonas vesicatoria]APP77479.1 LysR family transcriptional regulator [Xanthomonas vesicatoria ATCC 35937]EGD08469.1 transcriptional regulator [Xanthomonas vesicatoria ATCC 35937]KTF33325.1 LysR family transcriptional regulator [Xanthomonas vesicatoria]MCC8597013.1 LysR family transcriptional regulator [Xanthomonas vesicatoria]MCC8605361.1 LysR family transcriptional regulator [Xanthomonas vesicatoria]